MTFSGFIASDVSEKFAAVQTVYAFAAGCDERDLEILSAVFTDDAVLDFSPAARSLGYTVAPSTGKSEITSGILAALEGLTTSHSVTNPRVSLSGDECTVEALADAQHIDARERSRFLFMKNRYSLRMQRAGSEWQIGRLTLFNLWFEGDPNVLFAQDPRVQGKSHNSSQ